MRNILYGFILGIILWPALRAEAQPDTLWTARLALDSSTAYGALSTADGFVVVGYGAEGNIDRDILIAKISDQGDVLWTRLFGTARNEEAWAVVELPDGSYFLAGFGVNESGIRNVVTLVGVSSSGDSLWWRTYDSGGQSKARDAVLLADGNVAVLGYGIGTNGIASDMWLLKCQPNGDTLWTRKYGGDQTDIGYRLCARPDGGLALAGTTLSYGGGGEDPWLVLTNSLGNPTSNLTFGAPETQNGNACTVSEDNEIYLGGRGSASSGPALVAKCGANGSISWSNYYSEAATSQVRGLIPRPFGGVLCAGTNVAGSLNPWFMAAGADGALDWQWTLGIPQTELHALVSAGSGGSLAVGISNRQGFAIRLGLPAGVGGMVRETVTGEPLAGVHVTTVGNPRYVTTDNSGHYALERSPGVYTLAAFGPCVDTDTFETVEIFADSIIDVDLEIGAPDLYPVQSSLNITVHNRIAGAEPFWLLNQGSGTLSFEIQAEPVLPPTDWLSVDPVSGFIAPGDSLSVAVGVEIDTTDNGTFDLFGYLHLRTNSCPDTLHDIPVMVTVLASDAPPAIRPEFFALSAFPNPFNAVATVSFALPHEGDAKLDVFNVAGQHVVEILYQRLAAGEHRMTLDASRFPSGLYLIRLHTGELVATRKLLLLK